MHVCPALRNFEAMAPLTASSISASSKTINGALPPNSKETFLTLSADCFKSILPTAVEPVNDIFLMSELVVSSFPMAGASFVVIILRTPLGKPA